MLNAYGSMFCVINISLEWHFPKLCRYEKTINTDSFPFLWLYIFFFNISLSEDVGIVEKSKFDIEKLETLKLDQWLSDNTKLL